jgi:hypothetical protein
MRKNITKIAFAVILGLCGKAMANSPIGGEMTYKFMGGTKYKIRASVFRSCSGNAFTGSPTFGVFAGLNAGNGCGSSTLSGFSRIAIRSANYLCKGAADSCNPSNTAATGSGLEEHVYEGEVDFAVSPLSGFVNNSTCCEVTFYMQYGQRPAALSNGGSSSDFLLTTTLNLCNLKKTGQKGNNQVDWSLKPNQRVCLNQAQYLDQGVIDTNDHDRLTVSLINSLRSLPNSSIVYSIGYSGKLPVTPYCGSASLPCNPNPNTRSPRGIFMDTITGTMIFTSFKAELALICIEVTDWKKDSAGKWIWVGKARREFALEVRSDCGYNKTPTIEGPLENRVCEGDSICFTIDGKDETYTPFQTVPDTVNMSWNRAIPRAKFKITGTTTREKSVSFCWPTKVGDAKDVPYRFQVVNSDEHCPFAGVAQRTFLIHVLKKVKVDTSVVILLACRQLALNSTADKMFNPSQSVNWQILDSNGNLLATSNKIKDTIDLNASGKIYVRRFVSNGSCAKVFTDSLLVKARPSISLGVDKGICVNQTLKVIPIVKDAESPVKYQWQFAGKNVLADTTRSAAFKITADASVVLSVSEGSGCTVRDTLNIKKLGVTSTIFTGAIKPLCSGDAELDLNQYAAFMGSTGNETFSSRKYGNAIVNRSGWKIDPRKLDNSQIQSGQQISFQLIANYKDTNGCDFNDSAVVKINGSPQVMLSAKTHCQSNGDYSLRNMIVQPLPSSGIACSWNCIAAPGGIDPAAVINKAGNDNAFNDALKVGAVTEKNRTGKYDMVYSVVENSSGCTVSDTTTVSVLPNTEVTPQLSNNYCENLANVELLPLLKVDGTPAGKGDVWFNVFEFDNKASHPNIGKEKILKDSLLMAQFIPGNWGVMAYSAKNGCLDSAAFYVKVHNNPTADFVTTPESSVPLNSPIFYIINKTATPKNLLKSWNWNAPGATKTSFSEWEPAITYNAPGQYVISLNVVDVNACSSTISKTVMVENATNGTHVVNSNAWQLNNKLQIIGRDFSSAELRLFETSGKLVFTGNNNEGITRFSGKPGIYLYEIKVVKQGKVSTMSGKIDYSAGE